MILRNKLTVWWTCLALAGCADSLEKELDQSPAKNGADAAVQEGDAGETPSPDLYEIVTRTIDASSQTTPVYFDLDTGRTVGADDAWDLSFKRFQIQLNGGVSGSAGVQVRIVEGDFAALMEVPEEGFSSDEADGPDDADQNPDNLFNNGKSDWYDYNATDHTLSSKKLTYVVLTSEQAAFKLTIDGYYDAAGSPAIWTLRYARLSGTPPTEVPEQDAALPEPDAQAPDAGTGGDTDAALPEGLTVQATSNTDWVYIDVTGKALTVASPESDSSWWLAFKRTEIRTNSGTSGAARGGAKLEERALTFAQIESASTFGFTVDELVSSGAPGAQPSSQSPVLAGWYDYNPTTHAVTAGDRNYIVRGPDGALAKLRILRFTGGVYQLLLEAITTARDALTLDVDATSSTAWTYLSLRKGTLVTVADPATDSSWDLAVQRTRFRTNGGSSGAAQGAALDAMVAELSGLGAVNGTFSVDTAVSSGQPGSTPVSAHEVLSNWYDYDILTHVLTPKATSYVVRTADGGLGAFKIVSYNSGAYRLSLAYAGFGATRF